MRAKRAIALSLLSIYLLLAVAPATRVLFCPCLSSGDGHRHAVENCCSESRQLPGLAHWHLDDPDGCDCDHTAGVELYTFDRSGSSDEIRIWTVLLSVGLPTENPALLEPRFSGHRVVDRPRPCGYGVCPVRFALRAPPVTA